MVAIFIVIAVLAAGGIGYMIRSAQSSYERKITELESTLAVQDARLRIQSQRIEDLERHGHKPRNPYLTNIGLEDAFSIADDVRRAVEYAKLRAEVMQSVVRKIRTDPGSYDEDAPNSKRPIEGV